MAGLPESVANAFNQFDAAYLQLAQAVADMDPDSMEDMYQSLDWFESAQDQYHSLRQEMGYIEESLTRIRHLATDVFTYQGPL